MKNTNNDINESSKNKEQASEYSAKESLYEAMNAAGTDGSRPKLFQKKLLPLSFTLFLALALSILFFFIIYHFKDVNFGLDQFFTSLTPFVYGGILAYILVPMCNSYETLITLFTKKVLKSKKGISKKARQSYAIALSMITATLIIYLLISLILPQLIVSLTTISGNLTTYYDNITEWLHNTFEDNDVLLGYMDDFNGNISETLSKWIKSEILPNTKTLLSSVTSSLIDVVTVLKNLIIGIIVSIYLLKSRDTYAAQSKILVHSMFKENLANKIIQEVRFANKMFMGFISGRIVDSAIIGVLCCIGLNLMDMPYAFLISVIVGVTNIVPFFGPFIGGIPSGLLILIVDPVKCIWFVIFIIVLQQFDGNILGPKILGEMTNLNSFWVLFSLIIFSGIFGFPGMIFGCPVFAVIYHLLQELILKGLKRTGYTPTGQEAEISNFNKFLEEREHADSASNNTNQAPERNSLLSLIKSKIKKRNK